MPVERKTIVAGSREFGMLWKREWQVAVVEAAMRNCGWNISEVICGGARGADEYGKEVAEKYGIPVILFPADWGEHGKAAGFIRNREMAEYAGRRGGLVAVWDGSSKGTKNMIDTATEIGMPVYVAHTSGIAMWNYDEKKHPSMWSDYAATLTDGQYQETIRGKIEGAIRWMEQRGRELDQGQRSYLGFLLNVLNGEVSELWDDALDRFMLFVAQYSRLYELITNTGQPHQAV